LTQDNRNALPICSAGLKLNRWVCFICKQFADFWIVYPV